jgi:hypothetical protein
VGGDELRRQAPAAGELVVPRFKVSGLDVQVYAQ